MTRWVFSGNRIDSYIDPDPDAFKYGTFMYAAPERLWFRCGPAGPAPKKHHWLPMHESWVPVRHRTAALLLGGGT